MTRTRVMPRFRFIALAALWSAAVLPGQAQVSASLSPAEEKEIREFVLSEHRVSVAVPVSFQLSVGAVLPQSAELYPFHSGMSTAQFQYTIVGGKIVVAAPASRRVI